MLKPKITQSKILLHVCCAPCSGAIIDLLLIENYHPTLFFYNPNVFPYNEYEKRKESVIAYAHKRHVSFVDGDYDSEEWIIRVKGLESEPERGKRCSACFELRLNKTAQYASSFGFSQFATTNGFARWKDLDQVNIAGFAAAKRYPGLTFWGRDWRKGNLQEKAKIITSKEGFYQQTYCGCQYSLEKVNQIRLRCGYSPII